KAAALVCGDVTESAAIFRTSGTTAGSTRRGTHYLLDTRLYRASLREGFRAHLLPDRETLPIFSLVPSPDELPDSSLSFMVGEVMNVFGAKNSAFFMARAELATGTLLESLDRATRHGDPVLIVG